MIASPVGASLVALIIGCNFWLWGVAVLSKVRGSYKASWMLYQFLLAAFGNGLLFIWAMKESSVAAGWGNIAIFLLNGAICVVAGSQIIKLGKIRKQQNVGMLSPHARDFDAEILFSGKKVIVAYSASLLAVIAGVVVNWREII